jgi:hypothetical protein
MADVPVEVLVNPGEHRPVSMSQQLSAGQVVVALDKLAGRESVACVIHGLAPARHPRKPVHPITDGILRPGVAAAIAEQLSLRSNNHSAGDNLWRRPVQSAPRCPIPVATRATHRAPKARTRAKTILAIYEHSGDTPRLCYYAGRYVPHVGRLS